MVITSNVIFIQDQNQEIDVGATYVLKMYA